MESPITFTLWGSTAKNWAVLPEGYKFSEKLFYIKTGWKLSLNERAS